MPVVEREVELGPVAQRQARAGRVGERSDNVEKRGWQPRSGC